MALPGLPPVVHPLFVHFAIALIPASAAFAAWNAWRDAAWARKACYALVTGAAALSLVAMGTGFRDYLALKPRLEGNAAYGVLETHELLGVVTASTVAITTAIAWWKRGRVVASARWRWALAIALVAASLLVVVTAWYGGSLVYDHGVSVTDTTPGA